MAKSTILILLFLLFFAGCDLGPLTVSSIDNSPQVSSFEGLTFTPWTRDSDIRKKNSDVYGCYMSMRQSENNFRYWSIELFFPEEILNAADGRQARFRYRQETSSGELNRFANCIIPGTAEARELIQRFLDR